MLCHTISYYDILYLGLGRAPGLEALCGGGGGGGGEDDDDVDDEDDLQQ